MLGVFQACCCAVPPVRLANLRVDRLLVLPNLILDRARLLSKSAVEWSRLFGHQIVMGPQ